MTAVERAEVTKILKDLDDGWWYISYVRLFAKAYREQQVRITELEAETRRYQDWAKKAEADTAKAKDRINQLEDLIRDYCDDHCDGAPDGGHTADCLHREAFPIGGI